MFFFRVFLKSRRKRRVFSALIIGMILLAGCKNPKLPRVTSSPSSFSESPLKGCNRFEVLVFLPPEENTASFLALMTEKFRSLGEVRLIGRPPYTSVKHLPLLVLSVERKSGILSIFKEPSCFPAWKTEQPLVPFAIPYKEQRRGETPLLETMVSALGAQYQCDNPDLHPTFYIQVR